MTACSSAGDMLLNREKEKQLLPSSPETKHIYQLVKDTLQTKTHKLKKLKHKLNYQRAPVCSISF